MDNGYNYCQIGNCSHKGQVRKANEDYYGVFDTPNGRVVLVCDGMGGHVGGATASQIAVATIKDFLINNRFDDSGYALSEAFVAANNAILKHAEEEPELKGMGSTCVALLIKDRKVFYAHVGDSRIYIISHHRITQLTKDQSFVQTLVDAGQITKEEAEHHPRKNEITNALGILGMTPPVVCTSPIIPRAEDCFLLCTDGLTGMLDDKKIERIVSNKQLNILEKAPKLVELANAAGGLDNITVQLVEFTEDTLQNHHSKIKRLLKIIIPLFIVILLVGFYFLFFKNPINNNDRMLNTQSITIIDNAPAIQVNTQKISKSPIDFKEKTWLITFIELDSIFDCSLKYPLDSSISIGSFDRERKSVTLIRNKEINVDSIVLEISAISIKYHITIPIIRMKDQAEQKQVEQKQKEQKQKVQMQKEKKLEEQNQKVQIQKEQKLEEQNQEEKLLKDDLKNQDNKSQYPDSVKQQINPPQNHQ